MLVVLAAALHASWNLLLKRSEDKLTFVWWTGLTGSVILLPAVAWTSPWPGGGAETWARITLAAVLRAAYFMTLTAAYARGDLSLVYPVARGVGPVVVPMAAFVILDERLSGTAAAGIVAITLGIYVVYAPGLRGRALLAPFTLGRSAALGYAALTGVLTAAYSVLDKSNMAAGIPPIWYGYLTIPVAALLLTPFVIGRAARAREWVLHRGPILAVAILMTTSYVLVLHALQLAPVSYVAPARELGIVFGALLGSLLLGEPQGAQRLAGAALIAAGVAALAQAP